MKAGKRMGIPGSPGSAACGVRGVGLHRLPLFQDDRGNLTVGEFAGLLPFVPQRYFITWQVPGQHVRGEHAHRECWQYLTCVSGACTVLVDDGRNRQEVRLEDPGAGILVPPMVWAAEYDHTPDSVLMVFASHPYDAADYVRDYQEFVRLAAGDSSLPDSQPAVPPPGAPFSP